MAGNTARRGDLYRVDRQATFEGDKKSGPRPMVCVGENPHDPYTWKAMARTTSAPDVMIDLFSPKRNDLGLTKDGWWSYRFLRTVKKKWTGHQDLCPHLAELPEPLKTEVLGHYMSRPKASS